MSAEARDKAPLPPDEGQAQRRGRPNGAEADDGKAGGTSLGGQPGKGNFKDDDSAGSNAQSGGPSGNEVERTAPGMSTEKKADDTK
ncbi:hypothetical protein [Glacieibacterium sp.]|uniref:hypothetical protein n=1 Tax=Glacieibacterium sp. TaxID=2860237 RepID=UPI003B0052F8